MEYTIALFGPQATQWTREGLSSLFSALQHNGDLDFIKQAIVDLPALWPLLAQEFGNQTKTNTSLLEGIKALSSLTEGRLDPEKLTNTQLAPLTVVSQIIDFIHIRGRNIPNDLESSQGFCIGFLSAAALSTARTSDEFQSNVRNAIHLATCIGFVIDVHEAGKDAQDKATTLSVRYKSAAQRSYLETCLDAEEEAYISCLTDDNTLTITLPVKSEASFRERLLQAKITVSPVGLNGSYHHPTIHSLAASKLARLSSQNAKILGLPRAETLRLPLRSTSDAQLITRGPLHETAIDLILNKKAHWFQTVKTSVSHGQNTPVSALPLGKNKGSSVIPPSLRRPNTPAIHGAQPLHSVDDEVSQKPTEEIAVVGMSCRFPRAENLSAFWELLSRGETAFGPLPEGRFRVEELTREPRFASGGFTGNFLERADVFDHAFFGVSGREAKSMDPQQRLALEVAYEALEDGGYFSGSGGEKDVGCYLGVGAVEYENNVYSEGAGAFSAVGTLRAFISGRISHFFGWKGPSVTLDTACSSSAVAIHTACRAVLGGECAVALAGGVNVITSPGLHQNLAGASFLNSKGEASRAFDAGASGYCRGEGAGMVVLKKLSRALADGDRILGVIGASAVNQGSNCSSITVPDSGSQSELYRRVLERSGIQPSQVSYVEAHGTGTQVGDPIEYESVRLALAGTRQDELFLGAVKDSIGHTEAASGAAGLIKVLLMMQHNVIPKQANFATLNPKIKASSDIVIPTETQTWIPASGADGVDRQQVALVNNYGAAGSNSALLVRSYRGPGGQSRSGVAGSAPLPYPVLLSAKNQSHLRAYAEELKRYLPKVKDTTDFGSLAYGLSRSRNISFDHRAAFVASDSQSAISALDKLLLGLTDKAATEKPATSPSVVLCFGGQTGRSVKVSKELYDSCDVFRQHLNRCNAVCERVLGLPSFFPQIFQGEPTDDHVALHSMLLAVQLSSAKTWIESGVADTENLTLVGHSFGQLAALGIAGSISLEDCFRFVAGRARLFQDSWGPEKGAMLSVECSKNEMEDLAHKAKDTVDVACYNGPRSFVLAGSVSAIGKVAEECNTRGIKSTILSNSHAYHSRLADGILGDLETLARSITIRPPKIRVETCSADNTGWSESRFTAQELAKHTREPVYFSDAVQRIANRSSKSGTIWLEAGSATPIIPMTKRILQSDDNTNHVFIPMELGRDNGQAVSSLAQATCQLWQSGLAPRFWIFYPDGADSKYHAVSLPPYQFEKTSHWIQLKLTSPEVNKPKTEWEEKKTGLVTQVTPNGAKRGESLFLVDTAHALFVLAGRGHAVTGQSLCPASMYIELAALAAKSLDKLDISHLVPHVDGLEMSSPLGLGGAGISVFLSLSQVIPGSSWNFSLFSRSASTDDSNPKTEHARGRITWGLPDATTGGERRLKLLQRFGAQGVRRLASSTGTTGVSGNMVYTIFSDVVSYADYFRGVRSVSALENEAVGSVAVPAQLLSTETSSGIAVTCSDPIMVDNFLQVAGIHVNCLSSSRPDKSQVFVCTAVEEVMFTPSFMTTKDSHADTSREWTVYTRCDPSESALEISNDIFVCDAKSGRLVLAILGATFRGVPFKSLARGLTRLNNIKITVPETNHAVTTTAIKSPVSDDVQEDSGYQTGTSVAEQEQESSKPDSGEKENKVQLVRNFFSGILEVSVDEITPVSTLDELGVDSLLIMEVITEIQTQFNVTVSQDGLLNCKDISAVARLIWPESKSEERSQKVVNVLRDDGSGVSAESLKAIASIMTETETPSKKLDGPNVAILAQESFTNVKPSYSDHAATTQFAGFYGDAFSLQSDLVVRYVVDAFAALGCDLESMPKDHQVPMIPFDPKHNKLIPQLYKILVDGGLLTKEASVFRRTNKPAPASSAETLHQKMLNDFPIHTSETKLLHTTAPKLADCLTGKADPIGLIFQNAAARALLEDVYTNAPMFKTGTLLLGEYLSSLLGNLGQHGRELRILELGAGTGGTSKHLIEKLAATGHKFSYTFTDLSSSLVVAAKRKFAKYSSVMKYQTMDIEQDPPEELFGKYDVILSTNCIHATRNLVVSTTNIRKMLASDGILCLVELTRNLYWFDLVFGLLEGWWLFNDGRQHALAHEQTWDRNLKEAGFNWVDWSADENVPESVINRVITASPFSPPQSTQPLVRKQTLTFKQIDGLNLEADIYYPPTRVNPTTKVPIALMIHGGGHIMLSKNDIRPDQTDQLLANGFLPISIDYRLCPETTLLDGPMADASDALAWIHTTLPTLRLRPDVTAAGLDTTKIVAIGWSSGGHLAMTLAWTSPLHTPPTPPPAAILAFYCATDFQDPFWTSPNVPAGAQASDINVQDRSYNLDADDDFWTHGLMDRPITAYNVPSTKRALGGWLAPSDPRSRLALHMNTHGRTLEILLRGLDKATRGPLIHADLDLETIQKASPLAQVLKGRYRVPTFLIHPRLDDLIPWQQSERTWKALKEEGVEAELRVVGEGAGHLFDMMGGGGGRRSYREGMRAVGEGYAFLAGRVGRGWSHA